jgi:nucleotide-binding universal stress UspA family protein
VRAVVGPDVEERVCYGIPDVELRDLAEKEGADVVVVGRRGKTGVEAPGWFSVAFALALRGPFGTLIV